MKSIHSELALERILIALERDVMDATDEEVLAAARELGMNPSMKGSSAFFGVTRAAVPRSWPREAGGQESTTLRPDETKGDDKLSDMTREQVHSRFAVLTQQEAKVLRARFGIDVMAGTSEEEDVMRALARDIAALQKKQ